MRLRIHAFGEPPSSSVSRIESHAKAGRDGFATWTSLLDVDDELLPCLRDITTWCSGFGRGIWNFEFVPDAGSGFSRRLIDPLGDLLDLGAYAFHLDFDLGDRLHNVNRHSSSSLRTRAELDAADFIPDFKGFPQEPWLVIGKHFYGNLRRLDWLFDIEASRDYGGSIKVNGEACDFYREIHLPADVSCIDPASILSSECLRCHEPISMNLITGCWVGRSPMTELIGISRIGIGHSGSRRPLLINPSMFHQLLNQMPGKEFYSVRTVFAGDAKEIAGATSIANFLMQKIRARPQKKTK